MMLAILYTILLIITFSLGFFLVISKFKPKVFMENLKTFLHKVQVFRYLMKVVWKIIKRGIVHDFSKFNDDEAHYFAKAKGLSNVSYGSPEYKKMIGETLKPALKHHYEYNSHHPEHHKGGVNEMGLLDQIEMLCDWKASTARSKDGDIKKSIEINAGRFGYSEETKQKYIKFLKEINIY